MGLISGPFLTYKLGGGANAPRVLNFASRVKRLLTPEKYPFCKGSQLCCQTTTAVIVLQ